ncbi:MAG: PspC domain-containing protein [Burkholderiales bacterium]|nr:PspC domain-containing protein [Burkholderiales bacterium]
MNIADEIARLHELNRSGALTDEEFARAKEKLLASLPSGGDRPIDNLNQLRRSKSDQWLGGVCAGFARFTSTEAWVWRLMFVISVVCFGFGFLAYLLAWIFIPLEE